MRFFTMFLAILTILGARPAAAVYQCGGVQDTCPCGGNNPYPCCDNDGNCTWYSWHSACCHWGMALPGWGNAKTWVQYAAANANFEVLPAPVVGAIACRTQGTYGHVAFVIEVQGANIVVEEQNCCSTCAGGMRTHTYTASYFDGGFIVPVGGVVPPPCEIAIDGEARIIDELTTCFERHGQYWWDESAGHDGHHFYTYTTDDAAADSWAAWRLNVTVPGNYELSVFVPANALAVATLARYRVVVAGGEHTVVVDQATSAGQWVSLGRHWLAEGTEQHVRLDDNTGESYDLRRVLLYDALAVAPVPDCTDACADGDAVCDGDAGFRVCGRYDGDPCTKWGPVSFCGTDESCVEGECAPDPQGCVDDCLAAGRFCAGEGATVDCGQFDDDDCLDEGPVTPCPAGTACFGGACREADDPDAGPDAGDPPGTPDDGCNCRAGGAPGRRSDAWWIAPLFGAWLFLRRRRSGNAAGAHRGPR
jgi:MYXO-CTERM domain-containing protein